jgi:hypothetical protein
MQGRMENKRITKLVKKLFLRKGKFRNTTDAVT